MSETIETIFPSSKNYTNDLIKIFSFLKYLRNINKTTNTK